jgi:hypothetical protein
MWYHSTSFTRRSWSTSSVLTTSMCSIISDISFPRHAFCVAWCKWMGKGLQNRASKVCMLKKILSLMLSYSSPWQRSVLSRGRLPSIFDDHENYSTVTIQRDLFYGYDTLMENVSDPSHINFAHHKVNTYQSLWGPSKQEKENL